MNIYNLYLDESVTHDNSKNKHFSIAGIIVEEKYHENFLNLQLAELKKKVWGNDYPIDYNRFILHEKDIKEALNPKNKGKLKQLSTEYQRFSNFKNAKIVYDELERIIRNKEIHVIGGCIIEDELKKHYYDDVLTDQSLILLQIILENFCHFLKEKNGVGKIYYESIGEMQNRAMSMRFHHIKALGTMFVHPYAMQTLIKDITFPNKSENVSGLQIADFIPNNIVRFIANKPKNKLNLYNAINKTKYDGGLNKPEKYGIKIIP